MQPESFKAISEWKSIALTPTPVATGEDESRHAPRSELDDGTTSHKAQIRKFS